MTSLLLGLVAILLLQGVVMGNEASEPPPYRVIPESSRIAPPCWRDIDGYERVAIYWDYTMVIDDVLLRGDESTGFYIHGRALLLEPTFVQRLAYQCKEGVQSQAFRALQVNDSFTCYDYFATFPPLSNEIPLECYNDTYIIRNNTEPVHCNSAITCSTIFNVLCLNTVSPVTGRCFTTLNCTTAFSDCVVFCRCLYLRPTQAPTPAPSALPSPPPTGSPTSTTSPTPPTNGTGIPTTAAPTGGTPNNTGVPTVSPPPSDSSFPWEAFGIALVVIVIILICCLFIATLAIRRNRGTLNYRG